MMPQDLVQFQCQLSAILETVLKGALSDITRLVEESFLQEVSQRRREVQVLTERLLWAERRREWEEPHRIAEDEAAVETQSGLSVDVKGCHQETQGNSTFRKLKGSASSAVLVMSTTCNFSASPDIDKISEPEVLCKEEDVTPQEGQEELDQKEEICEEKSHLSPEKDVVFRDTDTLESTNVLGAETRRWDQEEAAESKLQLQNENFCDKRSETVAQQPAGSDALLPSEPVLYGSVNGTGCGFVKDEAEALPVFSGNETPADEERPFTCLHCGKTFSRQRNLKDHQRYHTGDKLHKCHHCGKGFVYMCHLRVHLRSHEDEPPFPCQLCSKSFTYLSNLKAHQKHHSGERPFGCNICGKKFRRMCHLKKHRLLHSRERPYKCTECTKQFVTKGYLNRHRKTHAKLPLL